MKPKPCTINPSRGRTDRAQEEGSIVVTPGQRVRLILSLGVLNLVLATIALGIGGVELQQQAAASQRPADIAAIPTPTPAEVGPTDAPVSTGPTSPSGQPPAEPSSGAGPSLASASPSTAPGASALASVRARVTCHGNGITRADLLAGRHPAPVPDRPGRPDAGGHRRPDTRGDDGTDPTRHRGTDRHARRRASPRHRPHAHSRADAQAHPDSPRAGRRSRPRSRPS